MTTFWTVLLAMVLALAGKTIGRFYAKTHLTDDTSAILTNAAHRASLKRVGFLACGALLFWLAMIVVSPFIARWIKVVGWAPLIVLNCCLALLAGTTASLAALLRRPERWDAIQAQIEQRERLIDYLKRFLPAIVFAVLATIGSARAAGDCFYALDPSASMNLGDLHDGRSFLKRTGWEAASTFGCKRVAAVTLGCEVRFARRVWLDVPADLPRVDCSKAEPEPLEGHSRFWDHVRGIFDTRKKDAVDRCEQEQATRAKKHEAEVAAFADALDAAFSTSDPSRCSLVTDSVRDALGSGLYAAVVVVTDAVDNPPARLKGLVVPDGSRVVLILARPNPAYARVEVSLARAEAWSGIPGVTVVTTAELRPDFWRSTFREAGR